jgi:hypothetical protein
MPVLVAGIHVFDAAVDGRDKRGHDGSVIQRGRNML